MTRLNLIHPLHLTNRHLVAEYKEITQFLHLVKRRIDKGDKFKDLPENFTLNTGHCKFFYDKGYYILNRFDALYHEMVRRNIKTDEDNYIKRRERITESYNNDSLWNDWQPDKKDYIIVVDRITQRIKEKSHLYPDSDIFFNSLCYYI